MNPLLTRRQTLQSLAYSTVFGSSILALVGCGGGGHGGGTTTASFRVAVEIPSGLSVPAADLEGATAYGAAPVANGAFSAKVAAKGPTFAYVRQKSTGKPVLFGLVGPGRPGVTPLASAVAAVALALGVTGLPAVSLTQTLGLLEADPAVVSLAATVATTLATDPFALTNGNEAIAAAVKTAVDSLGGGRPQRFASEALRARGETAPLILVQPGEQGGARVDQGDDGGTVVPTNLRRRPMAAYTYLVGHLPGVGAASSAPAVRIDAQDIDSTSSIGDAVTSLGTKAALAPVAGKPVALPISGADTETFYETVVLMASGDGSGDPAFFASARYAGEVAEWRTKLEALNVSAFLGGVLFDLFKTVLGAAATRLSAAGIAQIAADLAALEAGAADSVLTLVRQGTYGVGARVFLGRLVTGDAAAVRSIGIALRIAGDTEKAAAAAAAGAEGLAVAAIASFALAVLAAAGTLVTATDAGLTYFDVVASPKAEVWQETALKPGVTITPQKQDVRKGQSLGLAAKLTSATGITATYTWTLAGGTGFDNIADVSGHVGKSFSTDDAAVTLATTPSSQGTLTVTVEAFDKVSHKSLGQAVATLTLVDNAPVTEPGALSLLYGTYPDGLNRGFVDAVVTFGEVSGATYYAVHGDGPAVAGYPNGIDLTYRPGAPYIDQNGVAHPFTVGLSGFSGGLSGDDSVAVEGARLQARFAPFTFTVTAYFTN